MTERDIPGWKFGTIGTLKNLIILYDEVIEMIREQDNIQSIWNILKKNDCDMEIWEAALYTFGEQFHITPRHNYVGKYPCNAGEKDHIIELLMWRLDHLEDTLML